MKKPGVQDLVYSKTYPKPRTNDPISFVQHIQRCLVPEVREEVQRYFGRIDCIEAQYPGLDYTFAPHRRRLASFPWHRRLFRVFDELRLTSDEVLNLCTWEGTRAAKERFERESGTKIEITTLHDVAEEPQGRGPRAVFHMDRSTSQYRALEDTTNRAAGKRKAHVEDDQSDEDETEESIGVHLNQQLIAAADARERGETATFNQQWEQWMKEALERNEMDPATILETIRQGRPFPPALVDEQSSSSGLSRLDRVQEPRRNSHVDTPARSDSPTAAPVAEDQLHEMLGELSRSSASRGPTAQTPEVSASPRHSSEHARLSNLVETLQSSTTRLEADNTAMLNYLSRQRTETAR